ncbi:MAG: biotin transporter BioY [Chlamydiales bacterium]|nr:biotin transporter BioY [Chlamydiales bacterium]
MNSTILARRSITTATMIDVLQVLLGGCLISLFAKAMIYLPFTPVPIVLQNSLILLIAAHLGARKGFLATLVFIFQGAVGLPVFAGGSGSLLTLIGPTGGYIIGYAFAAYLVGYLFQHTRKLTPIKAFIYFSTANFCLIHLLGVFQLAFFIGLKQAILLGSAPFILVDILKNMLIVKCYFLSRR